ncbi:SDR family oxidoreductase [Pararhizobium mangrovi]|uniref:NmrA/HSCARG family protein n=1 Tax=Pararhizobium mangrovi TaxID=2590452 RepID=A0A506U2K6_9HYPH|nr:NmrA family NAD(P)-binding protein [Pararhizobium mangrovi]TPW27698.1 NmrA/HSCARG family protein [Pararhizobium mangrovi]
MTILVTSSTGTIGSRVVKELVDRGAEVKALMRDRSKAGGVPGAEPIVGDLSDPEGMRDALDGVDTLFLLSPVVPEELTLALLNLRLAADFQLKGIVYFSMANADALVDVPHAAAKFAAERMIQKQDLPATILRPNYFMQNDMMIKDALLEQNQYAMPIGQRGAAMVDVRDIAEVAALELLKRDRAPDRLPRDLIDISGPDVLNADRLVSIWSEALGRPISYAGDDLEALERQHRTFMTPSMAFDVALMFDGWQQIGVLPMTGAVDRLTATLGRPLRTYQAFAEETAQQWRS